MDSKREEFEKWAIEHKCAYRNDQGFWAFGGYNTAQMWLSWQAALASLQPAQPVYYSITVNGQHCGNFWPFLKDAQVASNRLNESYPQDRREVVPLYASPLPQSDLSTDAQKVRDQALTAELVKDLEFAIALAGKAYPERAEAISMRLSEYRTLQSQPAGTDAEDARRLDFLEKNQLGLFTVVDVVRRPTTMSSPAYEEVREFVGWSVHSMQDEFATAREAIDAAMQKSAAIAQQENGR